MDINLIKKQFPILSQSINDHILIYLDNAGMSQMPEKVMRRILEWEGRERSNIHSGLHSLSQKSTEVYELARQKIGQFIGADEDEIVFVKNTTEAINLVAYTWARKNLKRGDAILISELEHHSNILPWKILSDEIGVELKWLPIDNKSQLSIVNCQKLLDDKVKLIALSHVSNVLGTINPIKEIIKVARDKNIVTLIDGAQAVSHLAVDVKELGCDFYAFSGYKLYGPTGIGVLYGRREILETLPPFLSGGGTILSVTKDKIKWREAPEKLEGGTPNIAGAVGLAEAISFLSEIGMDNVSTHERELTTYALDKLKLLCPSRESGNPSSSPIIIFGPKEAKNQVSVISFNINGVHAHDVATILDEQGIAIRAGQHCAGPLLERLNVPATCRISFGVYNTLAEIDILIKVLQEVISKFK